MRLRRPEIRSRWAPVVDPKTAATRILASTIKAAGTPRGRLKDRTRDRAQPAPQESAGIAPAPAPDENVPELLPKRGAGERAARPSARRSAREQHLVAARSRSRTASGVLSS